MSSGSTGSLPTPTGWLTESEALQSGKLLQINANALPLGGTQYDYSLADGGTLTYDVPPAGFRPLDATDTQLAQ